MRSNKEWFFFLSYLVVWFGFLLKLDELEANSWLFWRAKAEAKNRYYLFACISGVKFL